MANVIMKLFFQNTFISLILQTSCFHPFSHTVSIPDILRFPGLIVQCANNKLVEKTEEEAQPKLPKYFIFDKINVNLLL